MKKINLITNSLLENISVVVDDINIQKGENVVFESEKGIFIGQVIGIENLEEDSDLHLKDFKIIRKANNEDIQNNEKNNSESTKVLAEVKKMSLKLELSMSFVDAVYSLDRKRLYLMFISESRVDFRELAKRVAQKYHARIEFRQIGVRDKAKKIGGIGPCGLMLCCNRFLNDFESVSINMAKNQMLALNPNKINGICGRLKCCLNYENDIYEEKRKGLPKVGSLIETSEGMGKVIDINILQRICKVELPNKNVVSIDIN